MFKSYQDRLGEIEALYNDKQYNSTIVESAKLAEKAIGLFFDHFHTFLKTHEDNLRYLEFEKEGGDKYIFFLKKPTIGVGIGYYNRLLTMFPDKPGMSLEIRNHLNTINVIRNSHVHAHDNPATADEAGQALDALEKILLASKLLGTSLDVAGVPLKYYLVVTSIETKFEKAEAEEDFKKIISDAIKVIPPLLDVLLNRVYHSLSIDEKFRLIERYFSTDKHQRNPSEYLDILLDAGVFAKLDRGDQLKGSLAEIAGNPDVFTRRLTRHYVNTLQIVVQHADNPATRHFLEFANSLKKRYLKKRKLEDRDRIVLQDRATELAISPDLAKRIEEAVITTIEKELILYQTLTAEPEPGEAPSPVTQKGKPAMRKIVAAMAVFSIVILSALFFFLIWSPSAFEAYEAAFLENNLKECERLAKDERTLSNVKAHYYYILSASFNNVLFPEDIKNEYRKLLRENPNSAQATWYLGQALLFGRRYREEADSAIFLLNKARQIGLKGIEIDLLHWQQLTNLNQQQKLRKLIDTLKMSGHPRALHLAAATVLSSDYDTIQAISLWERAITAYPRFVKARLEIAEIQLKRRDFDRTRELLQQAKDINPQSEGTIELLARLSKEEGRFDEAKGYFRSAIASFGVENKQFYYGLLDILLQEDSIEIGKKFLEVSLKKFPKDIVLLNNFQNSFNARERWLRDDATLAKEKNLQSWGSNLDEALAKSKKEGKPILVDFYTTWCYWCKVLDQRVYPDSTVQLQLKNYVLVKINAEQQTKIRDQYEVDKYPTLLVLDETGKKLMEATKYVTPVELTESLQSGYTAYQKDAEGKKVTKEKFTLASNLEDAKIIARSKGIPIMLVIGDSRSTWSERLTKKSMENQSFRSEFTEIIHLPVDNKDAPEFIKSFSVTHFPTILFLDETGKEYYRTEGYQPPAVLIDRVTKAKQGYKSRKVETTTIHWYYDFDEAIAEALVAKKNVFLAGFDPHCDPCNWMEKETFNDARVAKKLNEDFICLHLDRNEDKEIVSRFGLVFPSQMILNESGGEMFSSTGYKGPDELIAWLSIDEKVQLLSVLGPDRFKTFSEENSMIKTLLMQGMYLSASELIKSELNSLADYGDLYSDLTESLAGMDRFDEAIEACRQGFQKGNPVVENKIEEIFYLFVSAHRLNELNDWLESSIPENKKDGKTKALIAWVSSRASELIGNKEEAMKYAKAATFADPANFKTHVQLGILLFHEQQFQQADESFAKAEKADKQDPVASFYRGLIASKKGLASEKKRYFAEATRRSTWAWRQVGEMSLANTENYYTYPLALNRIVQGAENGLLLESAEWFPYYFKAVHEFYQKEYEAALQSINSAIKANPDIIYPQYVKSVILYHQNKMEEAHQLTTQTSANTSEDDFFPFSDYAMGLHLISQKETAKAKFYLARAKNYRGDAAWFKPMQEIAGHKLDEISRPEGQ